MNTHDDLLNNDEMCSFYEDDIENMCSNKEYDTCGSRHMSTKGGYVEILEFTHFAKVFKFQKESDFGRKKEISTGVKVSVVMELV